MMTEFLCLMFGFLVLAYHAPDVAFFIVFLLLVKYMLG